MQAVQRALEESKVLPLIFEAVRSSSDNKEFGKKMLQALRDYSLRASGFGSIEREIVNIFNLNSLEDIDIWLAVTNGERPVVHQLYSSVLFVKEHLSKVIRLLETEAIRIAHKPSEKSPTASETYSLLSVLVIEAPNELSRPNRLINVLESITLLYEANAILLNASAESLSVVGCDSGSDKSIDFLGLAKVMEAVKEVILSLWDRVVFFRERQMSTRINLIAESLPIIDRITQLEKEEKIGPEQAEILRRKIIDGSTKFIESGIIIPEIQDRTTFNPRLLLAPEPKLLTAPKPDTNKTHQPDSEDPSDSQKQAETGGDTADLTQLDPSERETLERLLKKVSSGERPRRPRRRKKLQDPAENSAS